MPLAMAPSMAPQAVTLGEAAARRSYDQLSAGERSLAQLARSLCSNGSVITVDDAVSR